MTSGPADASVVADVHRALIKQSRLASKVHCTYVGADLLTFWHPVTAKRTPWLRDIWVDLGLVTLARAETTLRTGDLITKQAALAHLPVLGAPAALVRDIHRRRYGEPARRSPLWRLRRADLTRTYLRARIPAVAGIS